MLDGLIKMATLAHNATPAVDVEEFPLPDPAHLLWVGFLLGASILCGAALLELTCLKTVRAITSTHEGRQLYVTAWMHNIINHLVLAPAIYLVGAKLFGTARPHSITTQALYSVGVIVLHAIGYYFTHRAMHTKTLWWAHRFHHKFNKYICPISAAAVTQTEYVLAYLIPFVMAAAFLCPMPTAALQVAGLFIAHVNNFLHTPWMEELTEKYAPWWWVGAFDHFDHHRQLTTTYAAPTLNIDKLLSLSTTIDGAVSRAATFLFGSPIGHAKKSE